MCYNVNEKILDREKEKEIDWNPLHVYDVKSKKNAAMIIKLDKKN